MKSYGRPSQAGNRVRRQLAAAAAAQQERLERRTLAVPRQGLPVFHGVVPGPETAHVVQSNAYFERQAHAKR